MTIVERTDYDALVRAIPTRWLLADLDRRGNAPEVVAPPIRLPGLEVDRVGRRARWGGRTVALTTREADVLVALARAHPRPVSSPALGGMLWPDAIEPVWSARTYVCYLRRKLPGLIASEHGRGYWLELPTAAQAVAS